jgi:peptidyl-prolyl cis-trans isomerase D
MLQSMRKNARYFYVLFFIVILSFIFWGVGTGDHSASNTLAEIVREKISAEEYWKTYETMRSNLRESLKGQFTEEMEKNLKLKEVVLNNLVDEKVLLVSAKQMGLEAADKEIQEIITGDQRFMRDGVFRQEVYFKTLQLSRITPETFENSVRQQLVLMKIRRFIEAAVDADPASGGKDDSEAARMLAMEKKNAAIRSYVEGMKQRLKVKINMKLIS